MKTDNELIAEFMGFPKFEWDGKRRITWPKGKGFFKIGWYLNVFKYDTSWDWLMPVVEKIHKVKGIHYIIEGSCGMVIHHFGKQIVKNSSDSIIETVYKSVVDFIKWHNEQKAQ